jgi:hypothetical protein
LGREESRLKPESYTTQSRFGSFTHKRFTVPQEVHSKKGLPFVPFPCPSEKALFFRFAAEAGTYVTLTTRSSNKDTADEL